jgi:hypothetical protein
VTRPEPLIDRVEEFLRQAGPDYDVFADELARHLLATEAEVRDAMLTLYAAGLVSERDGGPTHSYGSVWRWSAGEAKP